MLDCSDLAVVGWLSSVDAILPFLLLCSPGVLASGFGVIIDVGVDSCICLCYMGVLFFDSPFSLVFWPLVKPKSSSRVVDQDIEPRGEGRVCGS